MNWLKIENREFNGKKWEGRDENLKFFLVWLKYFLLKCFENNHKCVPFGLLITNINLLLLFIFFYYWPFLHLFWINDLSTNYATWKGVYTHRNSICSLFQFFFIITCSFSVFVENCILLPRWICCVPVYCTCMVLIFYPFTQIFSQNKNYVSECIFFKVQKCSIEIF